MFSKAREAASALRDKSQRVRRWERIKKFKRVGTSRNTRKPGETMKIEA